MPMLDGTGRETVSMQSATNGQLSQSFAFLVWSGQQGMASAISMASSSAAAAIMDIAVTAEGIATIRGAAGPIATPTAIPSANKRRTTARIFMAPKSHKEGGLRSPVGVISKPINGRLHH